ncbi:MAG TPA: hypothetical protein VN372_09010 [Methanospirillum sp.]|nr:hypothetical protein [Methanospirillum sp.]
MDIIRSKISSRCTDGSIVNEYTLDTHVPQGFVDHLTGFGTVTQKKLAGSNLYTFENAGERWISMKGMTNDTIIYATYVKTDSNRARDYLIALFSSYVDDGKKV